MSHEPECLWHIEANGPRPSTCTHCVIARAAYQRGRQDAARDTGGYVISNLDNHLETADFLDGLWNAALGGEQK